MYTDKDLNSAIKNGIFTQDAVEQFRKQLELSSDTVSIDEENFRLIGGFNDIFIVIACALLLFSTVISLRFINDTIAFITFPIMSWGLAEFFIRKRKMALPAIALLLAFISGIFIATMQLTEASTLISFALAAIAAYIHYQRFHVPITIAAGAATLAGFFISLLLSQFPNLIEWLMFIVFISGIILFIFAMYWDAQDRKRETNNSDVAFWLHLLSAPLIVHPVFMSLGIFEGVDNNFNMMIVILLYIILSTISISIDRRAFMVSALIYVLYAISHLLNSYGVIGNTFAITGISIGASILLLSAFWHPIRKKLVQQLPKVIQNIVPTAK